MKNLDFFLNIFVGKIYLRSATFLPTSYVCPVDNVLGRVPLITCYFIGNTCNTLVHKYRGAVPADAAVDSRPGSYDIVKIPI
jgi:hypothetical protein